MEQLFRQNVHAIYFDYDQSDIRPDQLSRLNANASWLKEHSGVKFTIQGIAMSAAARNITSDSETAGLIE
jgi:outer membrane protein OmpA-like peptidoglycan-associated protein